MWPGLISKEQEVPRVATEPSNANFFPCCFRNYNILCVHFIRLAIVDAVVCIRMLLLNDDANANGTSASYAKSIKHSEAACLIVSMNVYTVTTSRK